MLFFSIKASSVSLAQVIEKEKTICRKPNISLHIKDLKPTVKHGGSYIIIWGSFNGVGEMAFIEGNMNAK